MTQALTREARADLYREIFVVDKRGAAIFDEMVARFSKPACTTGGIDAVLQTYLRMGEQSVIQHIVRQINISNGVNDPNTEDDSQ